MDITLWKDADRKILNPTLFSEVADSLAREFSRDRRLNKGSQLRKFYDEVQRYNGQAKAAGAQDEEEFENTKAFLNMLIAKAAYAKGRNLVSDDFVEFLKKCIQQVNRKEDLDVFASFFEAIMGFYKMYRPKE